MKRGLNQKGLTLVETIVVIALMVIILPVIILTLIRLGRESSYFSLLQRINSASVLILHEFSNELTSARSVGVSTSTWGVNPSSFSFVDENGFSVVVDCPLDTVSLPGGDQEIRRLRLIRGALETVWLTDADVNVDNWTVQIARDSGGDLTGIRIQIGLEAANQESLPLRNAELDLDYSIYLPPAVVEL